ncbi:MAG: carbon monoxide dehydrogenase subunit G [Pseudomonadota bacterium]
MELTGEHRIPAPRQRVWEALQDPEVLKECIKGCQKLEKVDESNLVAKVQAKVGPVKATFDANVAIVDPVAPERYTLVGEVKGGVAGFAKGSADISLAEDGDATIMSYHAKATVGGKLAQLGSRLVDTTAKKYAADFFEAFSAKLGGGASEAETGAAPADAAVSAAPAQPNEQVSDVAPTGGGVTSNPYLWGILAFAVVILLLIALA